MVIGGVFNSGILAKGPTQAGTFNYRPAEQDVLELVAKLHVLCQDHAIELIDAALNFPLRSQAVTSVLIGTSRTASLQACVTKFGRPIPESFWTEAQSLVESHAAGTKAG